MLLNGIDAEYHDGPSVYAKIPGLNPNPRFPILGGVNQPRGGSARHDAVAWGYARAASALDIDIIQPCDVQDFIIEGGQVRGVATRYGTLRPDLIGMSVPSAGSVLALA